MTHSRSGHIYYKAIPAKGGVEVEAREINPTTFLISNTIAASTRTDAKGFYTISGLDDTKYYSVVAKGSTPTANSGLKDDQFRTIQIASTVTVATASVANLSATIATISSSLLIGTRITVGTTVLSGRIIDAYGVTGNTIISVGDSSLTQPFVYMYAIADATAANGVGRLGTRSNHPLVLGANNTEFVRIHAAGGMSVGTTFNFGSDCLYVVGTMSAQAVVDRTVGYNGDAIQELSRVANDKDGNIDHSTLPPFARANVVTRRLKEKAREEDVDEYEDVEIIERNLSSMISILTVAVQQLAARIDKLEGT